MFGWRVPDRLPEVPGVAFVPSYCLKTKNSILTEMSRLTASKAIRLYKERRVKHIIFSTAYKNLGEIEAKMKFWMAKLGGIDTDDISILHEITNSYDETEQALEIVECLRLPVVIIGEEWHLPRVVQAFKWALPEENIYHVSVRCPFERAREPSLIKSIRAGNKILWIAWQLFFYILTPIFMLRRGRKRK